MQGKLLDQFMGVKSDKEIEELIEKYEEASGKATPCIIYVCMRSTRR